MISHFFALAKDRLIKVAKSLTLKDRFVQLCLMSSILINISMWFLLLVSISPSEFPIPLHYNVFFGIDYIDSWYKVFLIPCFGILTLLVNFVLTYLLYLKERILSYFLTLTTLIVHVFLIIASYLIIGLNL